MQGSRRNHFKIQFSSTKARVSLATSTEKIKLVFTENYDFENQGESKILAVFAFFYYQNMIHRSKWRKKITKSSLLVCNIQMRASWKKPQFVAMEKSEFEYRDNSLFLAILGFFGKASFRCDNQNDWFFKSILLYKCYFLHWFLHGRNQTVDTGKHELDKKRWFSTDNSFFRQSGFRFKKKTSDLSKENSLATRWFPIET